MSAAAPLRRVALALAGWLLAAAAGAQSFWSEVQVPPLRDFRVPQPEVVTLDNGLRLFLLPDPTLPRVEATVMVRTGSLWDPAGKAGLAAILGQAMRTGGAGGRSADEFNRVLEDEGATLELTMGADAATGEMFVLAEDLELGLGLLADLLREPALPPDKIELARLQLRTEVARRNDDVSAIARRELRKLVFGAGSPFARHPEHATLDAITRQDLLALHRRDFWPGNVLLGLVGDFSPARARELVEQAFGSWQGAGERLAIPELDAGAATGTHLASKDDVAQTQFRLAHLGGRRDAPDLAAMEVFSEILGSSSFSSRLMREVRSRRGLAYSVVGLWLPEYERPGMFLVGGGTKNASTVEAMQACLDEVRRMLAAPPAEEELALAKETLLNSFVFRFDSPLKIVRQQMELAFHGYPPDTLERHRRALEAVTADDVLAAARRNVHLDRLVYLAVGKASEFAQPLTALGAGEPRPVDITIPPPAAASP